MLTAAEQDHFFSQGYVVKEGLLTAGQITGVADTITAMIDEACGHLHAEGSVFDDHRQEPFERRLTRIMDDDAGLGQAVLRHITGKGGGGCTGQAMLDALRACPLLASIATLVGPRIVGSSAYRIRPKLPDLSRGEVPWHQDSGYFLPHCDQHLIVTAWIPLIDADAGNGCLWVMPGAHREIIRHHTEGHAGFLEITPDDLPAIEPVCVPVPAGGALLMTNLTPHASFANRSEAIRWSLDLRYQSRDVPTNVGEAPADNHPARPPTTMACYPPEADFVIRDPLRPEEEVRDAERFRSIRHRFEEAKVYKPGRGWQPVPRLA